MLTIHEAINVKSPINTSKWQMGFNSAFNGLICKYIPLAEEGSCSINGTTKEVFVGHQTSLYCTVKCTYGLHNNV